MTRLFTTYYAESRTARQKELAAALACNAGVFDRVYVLAEGIERNSCGNVHWRNSTQRQTYRQVTEWAASVVSNDDLTVIANCDIAFPAASVESMQTHLSPGAMFALSRYEMQPNGNLELYDVDYSQDVWAFRGPPPVIGDFYFGVRGCDNAFAWAVRDLGYAVLNPSRSIPTIHQHASGLRTETNRGRYRIPPPYLFIEPAYLGEPPTYREKCETSKTHRAVSGQSPSITPQNSA